MVPVAPEPDKLVPMVSYLDGAPRWFSRPATRPSTRPLSHESAASAALRSYAAGDALELTE